MEGQRRPHWSLPRSPTPEADHRLVLYPGIKLFPNCGPAADKQQSKSRRCCILQIPASLGHSYLSFLQRLTAEARRADNSPLSFSGVSLPSPFSLETEPRVSYKLGQVLYLCALLSAPDGNFLQYGQEPQPANPNCLPVAAHLCLILKISFWYFQ